MISQTLRMVVLLLAAGNAADTLAQGAAPGPSTPMPTMRYGRSIGIEVAQKLVAAAVQDAQKKGLFMCVAITDTSGDLVAFAKMDDCQTGSINTSIAKARSAALYRRPSREFREAMAAGNAFVAFLPGAMPVDGGLPLVSGGKVIGAIGLSGGTGAQDAGVAAAALSAMD
jgi:uncharacterized protein GlcG (DUF336 family)